MRLFKVILFLFFIASNHIAWAQAESTSAGEVTSQEWTPAGYLNVTYAVGARDKMLEVNCTVLNENKKPIGGGFSYTRGGVATVSIRIPSIYQKSTKLSVTCTP